jgi:hypothetical protein
MSGVSQMTGAALYPSLRMRYELRLSIMVAFEARESVRNAPAAA